MKQEKHETTTTAINPDTTISQKKWYHFNLFQKFALIFFCVVAFPVMLIAFHVVYQSKLSILESTKPLLDVVTAAMKSSTQSQQKQSEAVLEMAHQEFAKIGSEMLTNLQNRLIDANTSLYAHSIQTVASQSQSILENELRSLNTEIAERVGEMSKQFIQESRRILNNLSSKIDMFQLQTGDGGQLWDILLSHEQFVYLDIVESSGSRVVQAAKQLHFFQHDEALVTDREPYLSFALSGEEVVTTELGESGVAFLRFFIPIKRQYKTLGVIFGVVSAFPLRDQIHAHFFNHSENIYIIERQGTMVYPSPGEASIPEVVEEHLSLLKENKESRGNLKQKELMFSFTTEESAKWKIIVAQPLESIATSIAPLDVMIAEYTQSIDEQLHRMTQENIMQITEELSKNIEARKQENRRNIQTHYDTFAAALVDDVTENISLAAHHVYKKTVYYMIPMILGLGILAVVIGILVAGRIIKPIKSMAAVAYDISKGNVTQVVPEVHSHDEIGLLSQLFHETTDYLWNIAKGAQKISEGQFTDEVQPVSEKDMLGMSFKKMTCYLRDISTLAIGISTGNLSQVVTPKPEHDLLGNAIYQMTQYLQNIAQVARKVAGGNLSEIFQPRSEKDFLGNALAEMIAKLQHLVSKIRSGANQLVTLSSETLERAEEEAESVEKISLSVEETSSSMNEMAATIGEVNERMTQLSSFVGETSSSIEELNSSIRQIVSHGEQLAMASEETSTSIQQISASLQQIADTSKYSRTLSEGARQDAINGRDAVEKMIQSMNVIQHMVTVTADAIQHLNTRTESIEKILDVIKDISDQTSLLSINASIIAKKAGERGRGFNVIADKVRKLADQSNLSAKEIAKIIRDVRKESAHAVEVVSMGHEKVLEGVQLAESAGKALDKIITGANESSTVVAKIAETTDEQTKISHHIITSMEHVVEMVNQIKVATKEQEQSSTYIMTQAEHVLLLSQQVKQATLEQTEVVKHVSLAMDDIRILIQMTSERAKESAQAASALSQHADALKNLVSQFTL
ncbi:MAG: methyl-accepting chemotaxis protein [Candidatus Vecturithrix sp.]|nr:methyl-accepting chemotaxis protein [Candidatus Vecturithrix sp.]